MQQKLQNREPIQTRERIRRIVVCLFLLLFPLGGAVWVNRDLASKTPTASSQLVFVPAKVTAVLSDNAEPDQENGEGRRVGTQELEIRILSGDHKNEILQMDNYLSALFNVDVDVGDRIIVRLITESDGSYYATMFNYDRGIVLGGVLLLFCVVLVLLGGRKGLRALSGLVYTLLCIWLLLIPGAICGLPPILLTVVVVSLSAAASLILVGGFSKKTLCAICGCVGGVAVSALVAAVAGWLMPLDGFNMSEAENLLLYGTEKGLTISGLMICGVLIAALGAVMDVSMSIASAEWELKTVHPEIASRALFQSGMNIGRDAMGTMANTLILAFAGSSLNMLILVQVYDIPFLQLINTDFICVEVLQSMAGSLGILLTVPLVAALGALMIGGRSRAGVLHTQSK